jgi:Ser/Thr protein kinase RdoA (MazF antagonist)
LDGSSPYTVDLAAASLAELAQLHVATWRDDRFAEQPWLASRLELGLAARGVPEIRGNFEGPIGAGVPDEVRDAERLVDRYRAVAAAVQTVEPWCVVHGDPHIGNVFLDAAGRPGLCDWQLVQRGPWYLDVGYHLAASLDVADRRAAEQDLVREYLERLTAAGVDAPAWDDAWRGVRLGIVHGFFLWGITLKVDPVITTRMLGRLGTAAADHDALEEQ